MRNLFITSNLSCSNNSKTNSHPWGALAGTKWMAGIKLSSAT